MNKIKISVIVFAIALVTACKTKQAASTACESTTLTYASNIKPIIDANCIGCHGKGSRHGDLTEFTGVKEMATSGQIKAEVVDKRHMPPNKKMEEADIKKISCWLKAGAN